jgi:ATPase family associated with various cellular activities (AAA)
MIPAADAWLELNNAYLGAELARLRRRLKALVPEAPGEPPRTSAFSRAARLRLQRLRGRPTEEVPLLAPPDHAAAPADETGADEPEGDHASPALIQLGHKLGLSQFERGILFLCVAAELDTGIGASFAAAQGDRSRNYPTFALAMALFEDPAWEALSPEGPLRHCRLIEIHQHGVTPLTQAPLSASERIVNYVKGLNHLDNRLAALVAPIERISPESLPPSQRELAVRLARHAEGGKARLALHGGDRATKRRIAAAVAGILDLHAFRLAAEAIPAGAELELVAQLWRLDSRLLPLALLIDAHDVEPAAVGDSPASRVRALADAAGGILLVDTFAGLPALDPDLIVDVARPTPAEQRMAWAAALGPSAPAALPAMLASQFDLGQPDIEAIAAETRDETDGDDLAERLWQGGVARTQPLLSRLAQRIDAKARWDDIVLPDQETALLHQIVDQVHARHRVYDDWGFRERMNRGLGISVLFAGDSGTGKTMAAEVIANALRLDLYRIDLSAVVSKYIGETEKNLRLVFDAAEAGGAILFFDEADALFGKRSEVKDSHDRYANIEINYLLQRMEAFGGLSILATNMKSALDKAFVRRLRFMINFPYPGPKERRRIWRRAFPPGVPLALGDADFDHLAGFDLSGGNIHSIALNAAFLAAKAQPREVTMKLMLEAVRMEFRMLERPVDERALTSLHAVTGTGGAA